MTYGEGCCHGFNCLMKFRWCSWSAQLAESIMQAFPGASLEMENRGRGGCDLVCALPDMVITQAAAAVPPDMIVLDFGQNGWGDTDDRIELFVRACHMFLPYTLLVILCNRDMEVPEIKDADPKHYNNRKFRLASEVAKHYALPLLDFAAVVREFRGSGGLVESLWPGGATRHPSWAAHAYYADMFVWWFNKELQNMDAMDAQKLKALSGAEYRPIVRRPTDLGVDKDWLKPVNDVHLSDIQTCLFPLTSHIAYNPSPSTPTRSPGGDWRLVEDRRDKPGWISEVLSDDVLSFNVTFSKKPKLAIAFLKTYEHIGEVEIEVDSGGKWEVPRADGTKPHLTSWMISGRWQNRVSVTMSSFYQSVGKHRLTGTVSFRLKASKEPKFKLVSVISC
eukprot:TRINITY_DN30048_c0_g1_i1.p1 TRINITY_DN30048_c0_g1~~TRINITY_DN30048_c0_g1_i1.p1  ORF type:complete len:392 (-),score=53.08 TRINITY_DN30048_c0_g1_i1:38-1213(-)